MFPKGSTKSVHTFVNLMISKSQRFRLLRGFSIRVIRQKSVKFVLSNIEFNLIIPRKKFSIT